ncbi:RidA family protein [Amycolatopsis jejuensis]|uniref:RidA family protein n=1 Tax=Amycolatopsis jejuensis TaxID=330084 RepID=UPI000524B16A|nr:RidA family protein [Amycolatopsis jejuensis]
MSIALVNPDGLPEVDAYRQVAVATGSRMVFLAGQVAWDEDGKVVGEGDLAAQIEQCYVNVGAALAGVGASFADVAKMTLYVVGWSPEKMPSLMDGIGRAAAKLGFAVPGAPGTLIGVAALDIPEHLVEVEAIAVLD